MKGSKHEIITFKADAALAEAMKGISNRSEFIRNALLASLGNICPVCNGVGFLTIHQRSHLARFLKEHPLEDCEECSDRHLTCRNKGESKSSPPEEFFF